MYQAFIVDAFSYGQLRGNAAAVVVLPEAKPAAWMQTVAAEFNQSETAFLQAADISGEAWKLCWFTPSCEVDLCGHATLASAHTLWQHLDLKADVLRFATRSGELLAQRQISAEGQATITLDFPRCQLTPLDPTMLANTAKELGVQARVLDARRAGEDLLLVLESPDAVRNFAPDFIVIPQLPWRGVIITAAHSNSDLDFVSRFFAPSMGVPEDPVTGAIHCALAPYWSEQLGKQTLVAEQWSPRGGRLWLQLSAKRVLLTGQARTFLQGGLQSA